MYQIRKVNEDVTYIGASDRRLSLFENVFPVPRGVSYNSYLIKDEKTALLDTVDKSMSGQFFENLTCALMGRALDYVVVNHMEPDHCGTLEELILRYPGVKVVCNKKTVQMIGQFFTFDVESRAVVVGEGEKLSLGRHALAFYMAPMVHWPEVMVTYDETDKTLYSADAFGSFGAVNGNIFADEVHYEADWLPDARRYYTNIVGKYGPQVQALLKKAQGLDIRMICPLHGLIWRKNINWYLEKYQRWSTYTPEENAVVIAYASVYGHTENTVNLLAAALADRGVRNIEMYDVSVTHPSQIVAEAFRASHLVFASTTYNAGIFCNMETVLLDLKAHNLQNRKLCFIENGTWAPASGKLMRDILTPLKGMEVLGDTLTLKSSLKACQMTQIDSLADLIVASMPKEPPILHETKVEQGAMFKLSYGLFVLSAKDGGKDNGCIINTVTQVTDTPKRIQIAVNKNNLTHDMILNSGVFNVSILSTDAPFALFQRFGFQSGRTADKFSGLENAKRSENGVLHLTDGANAFISAKVVSVQDVGTHSVFLAEVTQAQVISNTPSMTYQYYFDHVKPKPQPKPADAPKKKRWVCKICGYVYEGDTLPADFICPICKHGAADFELVEE